MKRFLLILLLVVLLSRAGSAAQEASPAQQVPPYFEPIACPPEIQRSTLPECGYLHVPENRANPDSRMIRVFVTRYPAVRTGERLPDPVFYLSGGPGGPITSVGEALMQQGLAVVNGRRDAVLIDQRGTGLSEPSLDCPEVDAVTFALLEEALSPDEEVARMVAAAAVCHERLLAAGIDLSAYNSRENAADINDLRLALGYEQVNLFGGSYGTRLALFVLRDHPDGVRSVILESAYPPQIDLLSAGAASFQRSLDLLFAGCAAHAQCSSRHPDLETRFYALVDRLNAEPMTVTIRNLYSGDAVDLQLTGSQLAYMVFGFLYDSVAIPALPAMIDQLEAGRATLFTSLVWRSLWGGDLAEGMNYSVQCAEEHAFSSPEEVATALETVRPQIAESARIAHLQMMFEICALWDLPAPDPRDNAPVSSTVPALVLAGEYDPVTPPAWGRLTAETLPNSFYLEFPGVGHSIVFGINSDCPLSIALAFVNDPTTAPDAACIAEDFTGPAFR